MKHPTKLYIVYALLILLCEKPTMAADWGRSPTLNTSVAPSVEPTSVAPSISPTVNQKKPSAGYGTKPTLNPRGNDTWAPNHRFVKRPSPTPTVTPSVEPTSVAPTILPTVTPSVEPTSVAPTILPTVKPTVKPTKKPTKKPTFQPTRKSRQPSSRPTTKK